jgi:protein-S-isoprenylcysteine O-methyltransferase Ste14
MGPLIKTLIFTALVPALVAAWVPLRWVARGANIWAPGAGPGASVLAAGIAIYSWCAWSFVRALGTPAPIDPPKHLVARGLYRRVRNPMYLGVLLVVVGQAMLFGSTALLGYAAFTAVCFHLVVLLYEEPSLRARFGQEYEDYLRAVPRWLPRLRA